MIFQRGMETIRRFIDFCGPAVYVVMFVLMGWILYHAGFDSLEPDAQRQDADRHRDDRRTWSTRSLLVVSYFAALLLNFGDFSRFAQERAADEGRQLPRPAGQLHRSSRSSP